MPAKWQKFEIEIPDEYTAAEREIIGDEIIQYIQERTQKGLSWRNTKFAGYSEEYAKSLNFKIAGKSKGDVNLTLSGDMLGALTVLDHEDGKLVIGFENGTEENAKADGNIRGTYGKDKPIGPKRAFLGITKTDLKKILAEHPPEEIDQDAETLNTGSKRAARKVSQEVVQMVEDGVDGGNDE